MCPDTGSRKPWVACIEAKVGCGVTLAELFNAFDITVDGKARTIKAPKRLPWDMTDADIEFRKKWKAPPVRDPVLSP